MFQDPILFFSFLDYLPLEEDLVLTLTALPSRMLCTKFGLNWPCGPWEVENIYSLQTDGRTTDDQKTHLSFQLWWAKKGLVLTVGHLHSYIIIWDREHFGVQLFSKLFASILLVVYLLLLLSFGETNGTSFGYHSGVNLSIPQNPLTIPYLLYTIIKILFIIHVKALYLVTIHIMLEKG